jgi:hypothetical protein
MKKLTLLTLPVCFVILPFFYVIVCTITEIYYFKKGTSNITDERFEKLPAFVPTAGASLDKIIATKQSGSNATDAITSNQ